MRVDRSTANYGTKAKDEATSRMIETERWRMMTRRMMMMNKGEGDEWNAWTDDDEGFLMM